MKQIFRCEARESRHETREGLTLPSAAVGDTVERLNETGDDNDRRIDSNEVHNLFHGCNVVRLLVVDPSNFLCMIDDTLLRLWEP